MKSLNKSSFSSFILILVFLFFVFPFLFSINPISGGDYINFAKDNLSVFKNNTFAAWDSTINLGWSTVGLMHYAPYNYLIAWVGTFSQYNNAVWERLVWWVPFFVISFFSIQQLFKLFYPKNPFWFLSPILFVFNTYILMVLGGGQISGIGLAYAIAPLALARFMQILDHEKADNREQKTQIWYSIIAGLVFALQVMFDLRIAYITLIPVGLYLVIKLSFGNAQDKSSHKVERKSLLEVLRLTLYALVIPLTITGLLHAFWLLPTLFFKVNTIEQLGSGYSSVDAVKFFSFAKFENTLSLLHPNWPENLFGKVSFMRPEFLVLPILAYASLLFIRFEKAENREQKNYILFFALLGLIGSFLAKGANEPFGNIYLWMFDHIPGFIMFRDSTKFYLLIALSYSVLVPFSVYSIFNWLKSKVKTQKFIPYIFILILISYFLYLIRPAVLGQLTGTFKMQPVSADYIHVNNYLTSQDTYFRNLWFPKASEFGFSSNMHPKIYATDYLNGSDAISVLKKMNNKDSLSLLQEASVKYVIVPSDLRGEIFLNDRKYDEKLYKKTIRELQKIKWLKQVDGFGRIAVFEVPSPRDHFWSPSLASNATGASLRVEYHLINPTKYIVSVENAKKSDVLVFSEGYDNGWMANVSDARDQTADIQSARYDKRFNSFVLPEDGNYDLEVDYKPQELVNIGVWVSLGGLVMILAGLVVLSLRGRK